MIKTTSFQLAKVVGDIFSPGNHYFAQCASMDGVMTHGLSSVFKNKYGQIETSNTSVGNVLTHQFGQDTVYYLMVKEKHDDPVDLSTLLRCLERLEATVPDDSTINIPPLACGMSGLDWDTDVEPLVTRAFQNSNSKLQVYFRK